MSYTFTEHVADGSTRTFPFQFTGAGKGYIVATDVKVYFAEDDNWILQEQGWSLSGTNQITFLVAPAAGKRFRIHRKVNKEAPFAYFDRGVMLDMNALNNSFTRQLQVSQEMLDGVYPSDFTFKQKMNFGGYRVQGVADGKDEYDAVNKGQLESTETHLELWIDAVDKKHDEWNTTQDEQIYGIIKSLTSNIASRTIPWGYTAGGGETQVAPPFYFTEALVWRDGVYQDQMSGAFEVKGNKILLAQPALRQGERVSVLLGSYVATPAFGELYEFELHVNEGQTVVPFGTKVEQVEVYLDGLLQAEGAFDLVNQDTLHFREPLPECTILGKALLKKL